MTIGDASNNLMPFSFKKCGMCNAWKGWTMNSKHQNEHQLELEKGDTWECSCGQINPSSGKVCGGNCQRRRLQTKSDTNRSRTKSTSDTNQSRSKSTSDTNQSRSKSENNIRTQPKRASKKNQCILSNKSKVFVEKDDICWWAQVVSYCESTERYQVAYEGADSMKWIDSKFVTLFDPCEVCGERQLTA